MLNKHDPQKIEAGLQQMQINTRLTALQTALELMKTSGYTGIAGQKLSDDPKYTGQLEPVWAKPPGAVDHITLLSMAGDIENYILGELVDEAKKAIEAAKRPPVHIHRP
jgi:hypothetical protein